MGQAMQEYFRGRCTESRRGHPRAWESQNMVFFWNIYIRDGFWETWMEGRNLGKQITSGGQSFGGGWNLRTVCGYWSTLQWAIVGETLVEQNMDLCSGCGVSALMRFWEFSKYQAVG